MNTEEFLLHIVEGEGTAAAQLTKTKKLAAKYIVERTNDKQVSWSMFVAHAVEHFGFENMETLGDVFEQQWDILRDSGELQTGGYEYEVRGGTWRDVGHGNQQKTSPVDSTTSEDSNSTGISQLALKFVVTSAKLKAHNFASFIPMAEEYFGSEYMHEAGPYLQSAWEKLHNEGKTQIGDIPYEAPIGSWRDYLKEGKTEVTVAQKTQSSAKSNDDEGASRLTYKSYHLRIPLVAEWLLELGFTQRSSPYATDGMFVYSEGPFNCRCTLLGPGFKGDCLSFYGTEITKRTMGQVEFDMPFHFIDLKETLAAILHYYTRDWADNYARDINPRLIESGLVNEQDLPPELPWRALGRTNKELLPWEKKWAEERRERERLAAIYAARPHCRVDRRHMRLGLNQLAETLPKLPHDAVAYVSFASEIFSISFGDDCSEKPIKLIGEGRDWEKTYRLYATDLDPLPKRLTGDNPAFGIWKSNFEIGRSRYPLIDKVDDPTEPCTE